MPSTVTAAYVTITRTAHHAFPGMAAILRDSITSQTCCLDPYCAGTLGGWHRNEGQERRQAEACFISSPFASVLLDWLLYPISQSEEKDVIIPILQM